MQLPIDIKILDDILIKIKELKPSPYNQKGMRDGKIFVDSDRYFINLQAQTYEIVEMEAWNGNQISPIGEITFDTNKRVSCIVQYQNSILLIYREKLGRKYYTLIGGHLQTNEDPEDTIIREVLEESNIHLENAIKLGEFDN